MATPLAHFQDDGYCDFVRTELKRKVKYGKNELSTSLTNLGGILSGPVALDLISLNDSKISLGVTL